MSRWRTWGEIPAFMKNDFTLKYYRHLSRKRTSMVFKRIFACYTGPCCLDKGR